MLFFYNCFSITKLKDNLEEWIRIGIGDDIVDMPKQREEYQPFVIKVKYCTYNDNIPTNETVPTGVLFLLNHELSLPWYRRKLYLQLAKLTVNKIYRKLI